MANAVESFFDSVLASSTTLKPSERLLLTFDLTDSFVGITESDLS